MQMERNNKGGRRVSPPAVAAVLVALGVALSFTGNSFAQDMEKTSGKPANTLYQRIGGYDVIAGVVDEFLTQLGKDPAFDRFGGGRSEGSKKRTRQLVVDQICALAGGPCVYFGRDMKPAHEGLEITQAEWDSSIKKLESSLDKFKVSGKEKEEFVALIEELSKDIIAPPKAKPEKDTATSQD